MSQLLAFTRKEFMEQMRTNRFLIMIILFILFGFMSPALAKLTPWLFETLAEDMAKQGVQFSQVEVTALTAWEQYYKNIFMPIFVLVVMYGGILTTEYQKGTLINILTKGLSRWKVVVAKAICTSAIWTVCYWICFGINYVYCSIFWDTTIVHHVFISGAYIWLFGIWLIALILFFSSICSNSSIVLIGVCGIVGGCYLLTMFPSISEYMPTMLMSAGGIVNGSILPNTFDAAFCLTIAMTIIAFALSILFFNKRNL